MQERTHNEYRTLALSAEDNIQKGEAGDFSDLIQDGEFLKEFFVMRTDFRFTF